MIKTFNVMLDTKEEVLNPAFTVNTNDLKTVKLSILINQDSEPLNLAGSTVLLAIKKPDNKTVLQEVTIVQEADGSCEVILDTQAYAVVGNYEAEVMVLSSNIEVSVTGKFSYKSVKGILSDDTVESTNEFQAINQAIADVEDLVNHLMGTGTGIDAVARADVAEIKQGLGTATLLTTAQTVKGAINELAVSGGTGGGGGVGNATILQGKAVPTPVSTDDEKVLAYDSDTDAWKLVIPAAGGSGSAITQYTSSFTAEGGETSIPIQIEGFDQARDLIEVYEGNIRIFKNTTWLFSADQLSIELQGYAATTGAVYNFMITKGVLATGGNTTTIQGKNVPSPTAADDEKVLAYDSQTNAFKYVVPQAGGITSTDALTIRGKSVPAPAATDDEKVLAYDSQTNAFKYVAQSAGTGTDATTLKGKTVPTPAAPEDEKVLAWDNDTNTFKYVPLPTMPTATSGTSLSGIIINVKDYGSNTAAFNSAISYISSLGGGVLLVPYGTYNISSLVVDGVHNLTILNYGILKATGTISKFIEVKNCNDFKLIEGTIDANNFGTFGVSLVNSPRFLIERAYVKNVGSNTLTSSAYGIGVGYSCNNGKIINSRVNYVHSLNVASGIGLGLQSSSVTDYELMPKHCRIVNTLVEDIYPQDDADGIKILSDGIVDCDLVVENCTIINSRKRGIKFQAAGCKSINNYIEFIEPFATAGIDFQRGNGSSNNDTIVFSGNPASVLDASGNVLDGNGLVYAPILISVGEVRVSGTKYKVKNDYSMLVGKLPSSSLVRLTWLVESGVPAGTAVKNVIIEDASAQAIPRLITFQIPVDNLTFKNNTVELMYNTMLTGAFTVTNFKFKDNKFSYLDTTALTFNSSTTIISSGDIDIQDQTAKMIVNIRSNDVRVKFSRLGDNANSRNYEQRHGLRYHAMAAIPSSFPNDNGLQFNSCAVGDVCKNIATAAFSTDSVGTYFVDKWRCTAVADATNTRGVWRAEKKYVV